MDKPDEVKAETQPVPPEAKPDEVIDLRVKLEEAVVAAKRWQAEYVNYQARVTREREQDRKYALEGLLREMLSVADALQRTQAQLAKAQAAPAVLKPVELAEKELMRVLGRYGVKPVEAREAFDPTIHDAIETVEAADKPDGAIVEVLARGYMLHDRVLRPATVRVARKPEPPSSGS